MFYLTRRIFSGPAKVIAAYPDLTGVPVTGLRVTPVPPHIPVDPLDVGIPANGFTYDDVVRQKYGALLAYNPAFTHILYDDMTTGGQDSTPGAPNELPEPVMDTSAAGTSGAVGEGFYWLKPLGGLLQTVTIPLTGAGLTDKAMVWLDAYTLSDNGAGGTLYEVFDTDALDISLSNDGGGAQWEPALSGSPVHFPMPGLTLKVKLENPTSHKVFISGLAILF